MKNNQFKVEDFFGGIISKYSSSPEQITKLKSFFSQNNVNVHFSIKINFFKPRKIKKFDIQASAPPEFSNFL